MSRPKTKDELLELGQKNFNTLNQLIDSYSKEQLGKEFPRGYLNRNIRDVLAHLHHWHLLVLDWYAIDLQGKMPDIPTDGYTWKTLPDLNLEIRSKYTNVELYEVRRLLSQSFDKVQKIIIDHTNEELFTKKKYKWTGTTSLAAYLISATSSHYDWAYKLIKKCQKR
jgi:hypothetical protein